MNILNSLRTGTQIHRKKLAFVVRTWLVVLLFLSLIFLICVNIDWSTNFAALNDFGSFFASGQAYAEGNDPYGKYPLVFQLTVNGEPRYALNLNPPISALVFSWASHLDPYRAFIGWYIVSAVLYLLAVVLLYRAFPRWRCVALALVMAGFWNTLELGQIYVPLLLLIVLAYLCLRSNRLLLAGIFMGTLIAVKPNLAIWPIFLFIAGYRLPILTAGITAGAISIIPLITDGTTIYLQWLRIPKVGPGIILPGNASLPGIFARIHLTPLGTALTVLFALLMIWIVYKNRAKLSTLDVTDLALVASILFMPKGWVGYTIFLLPVFFRRTWSLPYWLSAIGLAFPVVFVLYSINKWPLLSYSLGSLYGLALLVLAIGVTKELSRGIQWRRSLDIHLHQALPTSAHHE
jgi:hypothetical protein